MSVRALAFDVFGTVVDWRSSIIRELEQFGQRHGLQQDWPRLADDWRAGYAPAMDRVRRGELPWTRIDDLHRMILGWVRLDTSICSRTPTITGPGIG
jgi:2-haloacid dehalogenase